MKEIDTTEDFYAIFRDRGIEMTTDEKGRVIVSDIDAFYAMEIIDEEFSEYSDEVKFYDIYDNEN